MSKIRVIKRSYTSQNAPFRVVNPGIYDRSDFSNAEFEFLNTLKSIRVIEEETPKLKSPEIVKTSTVKRRRNRIKKEEV